MKREADVLVIGAGILGSSVAYYLAKRGKRVIVLEKGEICSGTSSTTAAVSYTHLDVDKRQLFRGGGFGKFF